MKIAVSRSLTKGVCLGIGLGLFGVASFPSEASASFGIDRRYKGDRKEDYEKLIEKCTILTDFSPVVESTLLDLKKDEDFMKTLKINIRSKDKSCLKENITIDCCTSLAKSANLPYLDPRTAKNTWGIMYLGDTRLCRRVVSLITSQIRTKNITPEEIIDNAIKAHHKECEKYRIVFDKPELGVAEPKKQSAQASTAIESDNKTPSNSQGILLLAR